MTRSSATSPTIRPAFSQWPQYNRILRERVAGLSEEQLALRPTPERWPLWATIGHWTLESLGDVVRHPEWGPDWVKTRGEIIQRSFAHDVSHISEINDVLGRANLEQVDIWR